MQRRSLDEIITDIVEAKRKVEEAHRELVDLADELSNAAGSTR